jgi:hypothetical protein
MGFEVCHQLVVFGDERRRGFSCVRRRVRVHADPQSAAGPGSGWLGRGWYVNLTDIGI